MSGVKGAVREPLDSTVMNRLARGVQVIGELDDHACAYVLKPWDELTASCQNGHINIDNNPVENKIRPADLAAKIGCSSVSR